MLNHLSRTLFILIASLMLVACHKAPELNNELALKLLNASTSGYAISIVTNNPNARGSDATGWNCADKKTLVDSGIVTCNDSGRSGSYLKFTSEGKHLLVGSPWGDDILRNANVIAVSKSIQKIQSIEMTDKLHAIINYTWVYDHYTPFANTQLEKTIALNVPQKGQVGIALNGKTWAVEH